MKFDCPRCGTVGVGVLLFNLVAPCDRCSGIVTTRSRKASLEVMTMEEMSKLEPKPWGYAWFGNHKKQYIEDRLKDELKFKAGIYWAYAPYTDDVLTTRLKYPDVCVIVMWEKDKK